MTTPLSLAPGVRPAALAACAALALLTSIPAWAGNVQASAGQNLEGTHTDSNPGTFASAYWPDVSHPVAGVMSYRTAIEAFSDGHGAPQQNHTDASGNSWTAYTLWNLASDTALDSATAATLDLSFNFRALGDLSVPTVSLSVGTTGFGVELYSSTVHTRNESISVVFGPVSTFPYEGYLFTGNAALFGHYDMSFSVLHENTGSGFLWMSFGNSASNAAFGSGTLMLQSITLADGTVPSGGLGVRLETGQILVVSNVPEPQAWALWLAGAGALGWAARRQRLASAG